ncbi:MAG TPA: DUF3455 domain-containing protein [Burkholderiales bacterium]|nr:DUF3455 domain-containing protein [Burkholderiales bacterium]
MKRASIVIVALAAGCASTVPVPNNLKPAGNESLALIVPAKGVQIYECREGKWAFVAPEAELFDRAGKKIGSHYAGPHWESADGSKIVGAVKQRADAPGAGNIPWLLLGTKSVASEGAFSKVTSIQRVATVGGIAPAAGCNEAGARARVPYTADYYLFSPK